MSRATYSCSRASRVVSAAVLTMLLCAAEAVPAAAQRGGTIAPGMTPPQVRDVFGAPAVIREEGAWTYFFYTNRCLPQCGSDDVVFFRNGEVVAAVLRAPEREFNGAAAYRVLQAMPRERPTEALLGTPAGNVAPQRVDAEPQGRARDGAVRGIRIEAPNRMQAREPTTDLGVIRGDPSAPHVGERAPVDSVSPDTVVEMIPADSIGASPSVEPIRATPDSIRNIPPAPPNR